MYLDATHRQDLPHVLRLQAAEAQVEKDTKKDGMRKVCSATTLRSLHNHSVSAGQREIYIGKERNRILFERDLHTLRSFLRAQHGHLVRAWRQELDLRSRGWICQNQLVAACHRMRLKINIKVVWSQLDDTMSDHVTLAQFAPNENAELLRFQRFLESVIGGGGTAAFNMLDFRRNLSFSKIELGERAVALGWVESTPDSIGELLDPIGGPGAILKEHDFVWLQHAYGNPEDSKNRSLSLAPDKIAEITGILQGTMHKTETPATTKNHGWKEYLALTKRRETDEKHNVKMHLEAERAVDSFRHRLTVSYGNLVRAWRTSIDPDNRGKIVLRNFISAARREKFHGNMQNLCAFFDEDSDGAVTLEEFDPQGAAVLIKFFETLMKKFGHMGEIFQAVQPDHRGRITREAFWELCQKARYKKSSDDVFNFLCMAICMHVFINWTDMLWLSKWYSERGIGAHAAKKANKDGGWEAQGMPSGLSPGEQMAWALQNNVTGGPPPTVSGGKICTKYKPKARAKKADASSSSSEEESPSEESRSKRTAPKKSAKKRAEEKRVSLQVQAIEDTLWDALDRALEVMDNPHNTGPGFDESRRRLLKQLNENLRTVDDTRKKVMKAGVDREQVQRLNALENRYNEVIQRLGAELGR